MDACVIDRKKLSDGIRSCSDLLCAIGDPNRQDIILLLLESGESSVQSITSNLKLSRPAVSYHLKVLKQAGIVNMRKCGTSNLYSLEPACEAWSKLSRTFKDISETVDMLKERIGGGNRGWMRRIS